jgi:hypothetical protein
LPPTASCWSRKKSKRPGRPVSVWPVPSAAGAGSGGAPACALSAGFSSTEP